MKKKTMFSVIVLFLAVCLALPAAAVFSAVTNSDKVKMFAEPTPTSPVLEVLRLGDVVKVYKKSPDGDFWEVEHKGHHGWIILKFLSPKDQRYSTDA